jgi:hypothetical protein
LLDHQAITTDGSLRVLEYQVRRAILCVNLETNSNANFDKFGHLASLRLGEIGSVGFHSSNHFDVAELTRYMTWQIAGYPIKPFAEKFVEPYLQVSVWATAVFILKGLLTSQRFYPFFTALDTREAHHN